MDKIIDFKTIDSLVGFKNGEALELLAKMIDASFNEPTFDLADKAIDLSVEFLKRKPSSTHKALLYYYLGNAWNRKQHSDKNVWEWENESLEKEIFYLRKSVLEKDFEELSANLKASITTNLGNHFDSIGRFFEAEFYWNKSLRYIPQFGMALGAKGIGLVAYANALLYGADRLKLFNYAQELLERAVKSNTTEKHAWPIFKRYADGLPEFLKGIPENVIKKNKKDAKSIREKEKKYYDWCYFNALFLNPLNSIEYYYETSDTIHINSITSPISSPYPPSFFSYFNQLKQEFVSARYLCYEGIMEYEKNRIHFADEQVGLFDTLDYAIYSTPIEKIKAAFKSAYSILDKIAFFLNEYFELKHNNIKLNFRNIWYFNLEQDKGLAETFKGRENWALRGLFWLSKDISYGINNEKYSIEPESENIRKIRNLLEHGFFNISIVKGDNINSITDFDFINKTIKMLKLAHSAISYLSLSVIREEENKKKGKAMPMNISKYIR